MNGSATAALFFATAMLLALPQGGHGQIKGTDLPKALVSSFVITEELDRLPWIEWTPDAMRRATPYPIERNGLFENAVPRSQPSVGIPGFLPGALPLEETQPLDADAGGTSYSSSPEPLGYGYPGPYTRYENFPKTNTYPYRTVGRLFFQRNGGSYSCSAASIGNHAIWTAGHCVHSGDGSPRSWSYNIVFVPAYHNGNAPYGSFQGAYAMTTWAWYTASDFGTDIGGVILKPLSGTKISSKVGALGFAWNQPLNTHWFAFGYPAAPPFSGKRQIVCTASYAYSDGSFVPNPNGIGCDQTNGASGGPWVMGLSRTTTGNYLNGNMSYRYTYRPEEVFSPYFDDNAKLLRDCLVNSTPTQSCGS